MSSEQKILTLEPPRVLKMEFGAEVNGPLSFLSSFPLRLYHIPSSRIITFVRNNKQWQGMQEIRTYAILIGQKQNWNIYKSNDIHCQVSFKLNLNRSNPIYLN